MSPESFGAQWQNTTQQGRAHWEGTVKKLAMIKFARTSALIPMATLVALFILPIPTAVSAAFAAARASSANTEMNAPSFAS